VTEQELIRQQAERWADPQTHSGAQARMERAKVRMTQLEPTVQRQVGSAQRAAHVHKRILWLREAMATVASAVAPQAACKSGCAGCCHQPVMMSLTEAQLIARETGAKLTQPAQWNREPAMQYSGQPCPFLQNSRCSIYARRPIACRGLFNMDVDALLCQIVPGAPAQVPYANLHQFNELLVHIHDNMHQAAQLADLRAFFPKGLR
jgi:hypothetical protein